jgi:predicted dehydrogenase
VGEERQPLRLGIAGCGRIVERGYLPAATGVNDLAVTAVADPDPARAAAAARAAGDAAVYAEPAAMVAAGSVDALLIATPSTRHVELASLAAEAGMPSLVEKPPAPDLAGAEALAALDPAPAIGFNRRFVQGAELAPSVPAEGWLELELEMSFRRDGWAAHLSRDEALLDAGTHLIDLAAFLTGSSPIAVRGARIEPERASLELELGRARAKIRCATDRAYAEAVRVRDRSGRQVAASRTNRARARLRRLRGGEDPLVESLRRQLANFAATVRSGDRGGLADAEAGVRAMRVVEAARRSAALGGAEVTVTQSTEPAEAGS